MARKLKITENEKYTLQDVKYGKKTKIMENEKHPIDDLKNYEITKKREK